MEWTNGQYRVTDERAVLDLDRVHRWLSEDAYWALGRPRDIVERSIEESIAFGLVHRDDGLVGFCRMVTDRATFAWLCDVYVDRAHRGGGGGSFLVECAVRHPDVVGVRRQVLATADAPGLYEKFGFRRFAEADRDRWMIRDSTTVC
jgi:N-acetylglutamate synthase-like GNAT family acetyltransferase